jgi:hypothetical protein
MRSNRNVDAKDTIKIGMNFCIWGEPGRCVGGCFAGQDLNNKQHILFLLSTPFRTQDARHVLGEGESWVRAMTYGRKRWSCALLEMPKLEDE